MKRQAEKNLTRKENELAEMERESRVFVLGLPVTRRAGWNSS